MCELEVDVVASDILNRLDIGGKSPAGGVLNRTVQVPHRD